MHGMATYFIRRLLLIPLTFTCITCLVYCVLRAAPGGPVQQAQEQQQAAAGESGIDADTDQSQQLSEKDLKELRKYYNLDKPYLIGYAIWLGVWPREVERRGEQLREFSGVLQGDFGISSTYGKPVVDVIVSKFYISIYFGLIGYFASWLVCVPLGTLKAIHHKTSFDAGSSVAVFLGYSIPGFVACLVLLVTFGGGTYWDLVPMGGFRSEQHIWETLSSWGKFKDQLHHTLVPVFGYLIGSFATMTILMKNSLLENLGADYVRTAFAKGLPENRVIFLHAMRNSLIPITAGIGHALGLLFAGSFLIEKVCDIPGMGLLGYNAVIERDYPIIMGVLVFTSMIRLTGNIISDLIWAMIDPRIRF